VVTDARADYFWISVTVNDAMKTNANIRGKEYLKLVGGALKPGNREVASRVGTTITAVVAKGPLRSSRALSQFRTLPVTRR
jgi:hypothetical protein